MEEFESDDILKFAIDREAQANRFYAVLAERMADDEMREVFENLAAEELEHKALLELEVMKRGTVVASEKLVGRFEADGAADVTTVLHMSYKNALAIELREAGVECALEVPMSVRYRGSVVGDYVADMIVENKIVVEAKAVSELHPSHEVQLVNYLKATGVQVGLLINFGRSVQVKRRVFGFDADAD